MAVELYHFARKAPGQRPPRRYGLLSFDFHELDHKSTYIISIYLGSQWKLGRKFLGSQSRVSAKVRVTLGIVGSCAIIFAASFIRASCEGFDLPNDAFKMGKDALYSGAYINHGHGRGSGQHDHSGDN